MRGKFREVGSDGGQEGGALAQLEQSQIPGIKLGWWLILARGRQRQQDQEQIQGQLHGKFKASMSYRRPSLRLKNKTKQKQTNFLLLPPLKLSTDSQQRSNSLKQARELYSANMLSIVFSER